MAVHWLTLPPDISQVHPIFHASMLRKYISDPSHVLQPHGMEVNKDLMYKEELVVIVNFSSFLAEFENHSDGQGVVEEQ